MLYDQAMLAIAYTEAHQASGETAYAEVARSTLDYVLRDLLDPAGGFRCAQDADSEGIEGKFYVWTKAEVMANLGPAAGEAFCQSFGVTVEGNVQDEATHSKTGANVLHVVDPMPEATAAPLRQRLLAARGNRIRPQLDDKVLTDWNGLAIAAFSLAGRALAEPRYTQAAVRAAAFLRAKMRRPDGRLRHRFHSGRADDVAFLDDHAFLLWGLLELYGATFDPQWLAWGVDLAGQMEARFGDPAGGFFSSPSDGEDLGVRRKQAYDGAYPSGNSVAAYALHRLGRLTGETRWNALADRTIAAFAAHLAAQPQAYAMMLCALDLAVGPTREVLVAGDGPAAQALLDVAAQGFRPRDVLLATRPGLADVAPWTREHKPVQGRPAAYVCQDFACKRPVTSAGDLQSALA